MLRLGPSISVCEQELRAQAVVAPIANFTGTPLTGIDPLSVVFTDTSANGPLTAWHWEKNDGSGWVDFDGTPTVQYPTETFTVGTWSVRMTVTNSNSSNTKTRTDYLIIVPNVSYILLEDGNYILLETTGKIILE